MMKSRLHFMLLLAMAASILFSCASKGEETADDKTAVEVPVVETAIEEPVAVLEVPVVEPVAADAVTEPEDNAPAAEESVTVTEQENAIVDASEESEPIPAEDEEEEPAPYPENEFIPVEEELVYIVDVSSYYDDFVISEDDFVVVEDVAAEPAAVAVLEPVPAEEPSVVTEVESIEEDEPVVVPEPAVVLEETAPVTDQLYIPAPREDMKKPVSVISEEQAAAAVEQEKEVAVSELEEILAAIPEPEEPSGPVASRSITIRKNDIIEVPYQGNWWVYLGDDKSSGALTFTGRDYISEKTVFTLRATKEGTALLHFFKQDIIANVMVDDYLEVIVEEAGGLSEKKTLDMFVISQIKPEPIAEEESGAGDEAGELAPVSPSADAPVSSAGDAAGSVNYVQVIEEPSVTVETSLNAAAEDETAVEDVPAVVTPVLLSDAELFARAQALEATDIEGAVELYKQLVANYPASPYWTKANNRITYINRFYFFKR